MKLEGKTAIVTDAGCGRSTAHVLAKEGCNIVLVAFESDQIETVAAEVRAIGPKALAIQTKIQRGHGIGSSIKRPVNSLSVAELQRNWREVASAESSVAGLISTVVTELAVLDYHLRQGSPTQRRQAQIHLPKQRHYLAQLEARRTALRAQLAGMKREFMRRLSRPN